MFEEGNDLDPKDWINQMQQIPIFSKSLEIVEIVKHLVQSVKKTDFNFKRKGDRKLLINELNYILDSAHIIPVKIVRAVAEVYYDRKMENATIIRKAARQLFMDACALQKRGFIEPEFLDLIRKEIEELRILFAEWVKTFDPWDYKIDRWGLFNPPGVNYDDPDDGTPFDPNEFWDEFFSDYEDEWGEDDTENEDEEE